MERGNAQRPSADEACKLSVVTSCRQECRDDDCRCLKRPVGKLAKKHRSLGDLLGAARQLTRALRSDKRGEELSWRLCRRATKADRTSCVQGPVAEGRAGDFWHADNTDDPCDW